MSDTNNSTAPVQGTVSEQEGTSNGGYANGASSASSTEKSTTSTAAQAAEKHVPEATRRFKLKVDGHEEEIDEAEVIKRAQLGSSSTKRFEEVKAERERISKLKDIFKKDALAALQDPALGLSKDEIRQQFEQWYRREFIEPSTMTPEQLELRDLRAKHAAREKEESTRAEQDKQSKQEQEKTQWVQHYTQKIVEAARAVDLPESEVAIASVAAKLKLAREAGINMPIETAVAQAKQELAQTSKRLMSKMEGEQLISFLGEELINKVRKADLARIRGTQAAAVQQRVPSSTPNATKRSGKPVPMSQVSDYFDKLKD